jgi:hypothetical protein
MMIQACRRWTCKYSHPHLVDATPPDQHGWIEEVGGARGSYPTGIPLRGVTSLFSEK